MSIGSAILALSPAGYWPLGDLGPSVIADAAGGGHNMTSQPLVGFSVDGVEPGTFCVSVPSAQVVAQINPWFTGNGARSFMCYVAMPSQNGPVNKSLGVNVFGAAKGFGNFMTGAGSLGAMSRGSLIRNGSSATAWNLDPIPDQYWHQYCLTYDGTNYRLYRDGSQIATTAPGGYNAITADATDAVVLEMPNPGFLAHCAIWASALTAAQVLSVVTAEGGRNNPPWVTGQGVVNPLVFSELTAIQTYLSGTILSTLSTIESLINFEHPPIISSLSTLSTVTLSGTGYITLVGRAVLVLSGTIPVEWGGTPGLIAIRFYNRLVQLGFAHLLSGGLAEVFDPSIDQYENVRLYLLTGNVPYRMYYDVTPGATIEVHQLG